MKLDQKLKLLPDLPGCYLMRNQAGEVIYVGKAKNLKNRVNSYFKTKHTGKTAKLVEEINDFETIITQTDKEAFLLEITLIQKYRPRYNIRLKNGKGGYPYIKITNGQDPRLEIANHIKDDGAYYFGPYPNVYAAEETLHFLQKVYPLRRCPSTQKTPCLYFHMHQCLGACFQEVPPEKYQAQIKQIKDFLNGDTKAVKAELNKKMKAAAAKLEFERAAEIRDQIKYIDITVEKQQMISQTKATRDLFGYAYHNGYLSVQIFCIRQARLMSRVKKTFDILEDPLVALESFILQYYQQNNVLPDEILVPVGVDAQLLSEALAVPVKTPFKGDKKTLLDLASKNARLVLEEKIRLQTLTKRKTKEAAQEIAAALNIPSACRIEAFDHSHLQGQNLVSAMVCYNDGQPAKDFYRKYQLKTVDQADEVKSTQEVIYRRYKRLLQEKKSLPDLILMDGGQIQVAAAIEVLENQLGLAIPVAGMVKNDKHQTAALLKADGTKVKLSPQSEGFYLLERIQDEVHRFAITYHRQVRSKNSLSSQLEQIKGVGPKTRIKLLKEFGSLTAIKEASVADITKLGISQKVATAIKTELN